MSSLNIALLHVACSLIVYVILQIILLCRDVRDDKKEVNNSFIGDENYDDNT